MPKKICTIGFSKKSLKHFIELLKDAGVTKLIDTRLHNTSQLAGFAKKDDLAYILELVGIGYEHETAMAPTEDILKKYKKKEITWSEYEETYLKLLGERNILNNVTDKIAGETICFLCSEDKPHHCHRRLLVEYINEHSPNEMIIEHLI